MMTPSFVNNDGASGMGVQLVCSAVPLACQKEESLETIPELQKMKLSVHAASSSSSRLARTSPASDIVIGTSDEPKQKPKMQTQDMTAAPQAKESAIHAASTTTNSDANKSSLDTHKCNQDQPGKNYDSKGRCIHHPHIRLRKKKKNKLGSIVSGVSGTKRGRKKKWKILLSICPECCTEELLKDVCSSKIMPDYIRESIHRNDNELNGDPVDGPCSSDCCIEDLPCTVTHNSRFIIEGRADNSASRELCEITRTEDRCLDESSCSSLTNNSLENDDELACIEEATGFGQMKRPSFDLYHDIGLDLRTLCQTNHEEDIDQIVPNMSPEKSSLALYLINSQPWMPGPGLDCTGSCGSVEVLADDDEWNELDALACKENLDGSLKGKFKSLDIIGSDGTATTLSFSGSSSNVSRYCPKSRDGGHEINNLKVEQRYLIVQV